MSIYLLTNSVISLLQTVLVQNKFNHNENQSLASPDTTKPALYRPSADPELIRIENATDLYPNMRRDTQGNLVYQLAFSEGIPAPGDSDEKMEDVAKPVEVEVV